MTCRVMSNADPDRDDGILNAPAKCAIFLDMDGTLLEMAPTPESVKVPEGLAPLLGQLHRRLGGAIAIITGRQICEADRILSPLRLTAAGVHGAEIRLSPDDDIKLKSPRLPSDLVAQLVALEGRMPGVRAEPKGPGLAMHYRLVPHVAPALHEQLEHLLRDYASRVVLSHGRKIFEIVPLGNTKGTALATFVDLPAFKGRKPVMIGDDVGDEPAFAAATRLGGTALRVAGEHFPRDAANLAGPADVLSLLSRVVSRLPSD